MIMWIRYPDEVPMNMKVYKPGCDLEDYLEDRHWAVLNDKLAKGCQIYYQVEYMGAFAEDEKERGTDAEGYYSFQC
jgi:hypothetical protein